jgi:ATPase subunit of ABC transporter with duplicated ATPase domains
MISTSNVSLGFGGRKLFDDVNIKFTPGNCYGLIGANGAGKSTFVKLLSGELSTQTGTIDITPGQRLSVLKQDHFAYDHFQALQTVLMGNEELMKIIAEKDALYAKAEFSEADGVRAGELEARFAEMNGWEADSEAGILLAGLGIGTELHEKLMAELSGDQKVKVLLAQALFGRPDILLLDEPTNHLDIKAINWLENFLLDFQNTVVVVSHDRHFLNKVCTHIADIDYGKIKVYAGNYEFWRSSSELAARLRGDQKKRSEDKASELKSFIQRFSANASKSRQATSRQKQLEKLQIDDLPMTTRKYPYVNFTPTREAGKDLLRVTGLSHKGQDGTVHLDNISFNVNKGDKIVFLFDSDIAQSVFFDLLGLQMKPNKGEIAWGVTTTLAYFPRDNTSFFSEGIYNLVDWLRPYSKEKEETFIRGFLGKMLFSGEEALKKTNVLSGGERVRCMLAKMMLSGANVLMFDGPTHHLDLESITAVNEALSKFTGTILFNSHDHEFIQTVANRVIEISKGKIIADKVTTYDNYLGLES